VVFLVEKESFSFPPFFPFPSISFFLHSLTLPEQAVHFEYSLDERKSGPGDTRTRRVFLTGVILFPLLTFFFLLSFPLLVGKPLRSTRGDLSFLLPDFARCPIERDFLCSKPLETDLYPFFFSAYFFSSSPADSRRMLQRG